MDQIPTRIHAVNNFEDSFCSAVTFDTYGMESSFNIGSSLEDLGCLDIEMKESLNPDSDRYGLCCEHPTENRAASINNVLKWNPGRFSSIETSKGSLLTHCCSMPQLPRRRTSLQKEESIQQPKYKTHNQSRNQQNSKLPKQSRLEQTNRIIHDRPKKLNWEKNIEVQFATSLHDDSDSSDSPQMPRRQLSYDGKANKFNIQNSSNEKIMSPCIPRMPRRKESRFEPDILDEIADAKLSSYVDNNCDRINESSNSSKRKSPHTDIKMYPESIEHNYSYIEKLHTEEIERLPKKNLSRELKCQLMFRCKPERFMPKRSSDNFETCIKSISMPILPKRRISVDLDEQEKDGSNKNAQWQIINQKEDQSSKKLNYLKMSKLRRQLRI